jgi:phosphoglycolate phosphatase
MSVAHTMNIVLSLGGGSMVGVILGSTKQEPTVVGKPSTFMLDYLARKSVEILMKRATVKPKSNN